jgi:hypothetical protein
MYIIWFWVVIIPFVARWLLRCDPELPLELRDHDRYRFSEVRRLGGNATQHRRILDLEPDDDVPAPDLLGGVAVSYEREPPA